jgi:arginyl-tRNA synthetase
MRYRIDTYHPLAINIPTDVSQTLHFQQLEATCRLLGWELPPFEHVVFGRMRFRDRSMSTRKGNILKLADVVSEAVRRADALIAERGDAIQADDPAALAEMMGIGALAYGILSQNRKMDIVFDWDKMLSFEGNSAPYLQYTHARARSVLERAEVRGVPSLRTEPRALSPTERSVLVRLLFLPAALEEARRGHFPHVLANTLYDLCRDFNAFYNAEPILKAEEPLRTARLLLTSCFASALKTGAELLTLRVPDRM